VLGSFPLTTAENAFPTADSETGKLRLTSKAKIATPALAATANRLIRKAKAKRNRSLLIVFSFSCPLSS